MAAIQLTSPLILAGDPTLPNHPATKQYVDNKANNLNAAGFSTGLLSVARLPAFTGDVEMAAGSGALTLSMPVGLSAGTYTKFVLDSRGRAKSASLLTGDDIANVDWSKITTGKPTTAAGYGIVDAIGLGGGTITGILTTTATPTDDLHLVNKAYVDSMIVATGESLSVGDVVRKGYTTTPSGFLRANGASVSKTTYAALYSVLGDRYASVMDVGSGQPWVNQASFEFDNLSIGAPVAGAAIGALGGYYTVLLSFVTKNYFYVLFDWNAGGLHYQYLRAYAIAADGSLTGNPITVKDFGQLSTDFLYAVTTKNKVYVTYGVSNYNISFYCFNINADGTLTDVGVTNTIDANYRSRAVFITKNRLNILRGNGELGWMTIDSNGNLGSLNTATGHGTCDYGFPAVVTKTRVYALKTAPAWGTCYLTSAAINSDGTVGTWSDSVGFTNYGNLLSDVTGGGMFATGNKIVLLKFRPGWYDEAQGTSYPNLTYLYVGNLDTNGVLTSWNARVDLEGATSVNFVRPAITKDKLIAFPASTQPGSNAVCYYPITNVGLNDYSPYYDGSNFAGDPNNFKLPDFTSKETFNTCYFVKY